jgi:phage shock protein PspC (stress-responsive transcriptional regulator)
MRQLYRSRRNRRLCGLCGGLAEYFDIDPTLIRVGVLVAAVLTGFVPILLAYLLAALIVPNEDDDHFNVVR